MDMSLKDDLSERKLPSVPYSVQKADPSKAQAAMEQAARMLRQAEFKGDKDEVRRRKAAVAKAKKQVEACFTIFDVRALEPDVWEALIDEHPPTPEQLAAAGNDPAERPEWDDATFYPALLAKCVDDDMDEADWAAFLKKRMSRGERRQFQYMLVALNENVRLPEAMVLPKGSLGTGILPSSWR
jgi:hypothetical protein